VALEFAFWGTPALLGGPAALVLPHLPHGSSWSVAFGILAACSAMAFPMAVVATLKRPYRWARLVAAWADGVFGVWWLSRLIS